jgi:hypothetical protein
MNVRAIGIPETAAASLTETFHTAFSELIARRPPEMKDAYDLLERTQMDKIFDQFQIQDTGCTDVQCAVEFWKMLSVQRIVISSVGQVGETYTVTVRLVDVESSKIIRSASRKHEGKLDGVIDLLPLMGYQVLTGVEPNYTATQKRVTLKSITPERQKTSYLSIESLPGGASVTIDGESVGTTPVLNYRVVEGSHKIALHLMGYETHRQALTAQASEMKPISIVLIPKARKKVIIKSLIIPGRGQWYAGHRAKGALMTTLQIATIGCAVGATSSAMKAKDDYDKALTEYRENIIWDFPSLRKNVNDTYGKASSASTLQIAYFAAATVVYAWNVIDAVLTNPSVEVKKPSNAILILPEVGNDRCVVSFSVRF